MGKYFSITLTEEEIARGEYKKYIGGGPKHWESKGAFQLYFLKKMRMRSTSKVLDVGCGPGRAAKHLIEFLDKANYYGVDYNPDFIKAAHAMIEEKGLSGKEPALKMVRDFDFSFLQPVFDYAIVFSVLNHCGEEQKRYFFQRMPRVMKKGGKVYISHALWFTEAYLGNSGLRHAKTFGPDDFDITRYGWEKRDVIFPIIEFIK